MISKQSTKNTQRKKSKKMMYEPIRSKYVDPFTDFGFKKLFGEECNQDLLLDFLNELLYEEQGHIISISYLKSERLGITANSRKAVFDLYCENEKGEKFIVELQKSKQEFFKDRTLYYSTFPIIEQAAKNKWNFELNAVYVIAILDFVFDEDKNDPCKYRYDVKLTDIETHKVFYNKLTFIYLEMPKFTKKVDELETRFEKWMYVIKNLELLDDIPDKIREANFEKMFAAAEVAKLSQEEYNSYSDIIKAARDWQNCLDTALKEGNAKGLASGHELGLKKGFKEGMKKGIKEGIKEGMKEGREEGLKEGREEGMKEGREKGIKEGREKGIKEGREKGIKEGQGEEKIKTTIAAYQMGLPYEKISILTGLTLEQISEILKQNVLM
jgi:predicted transposase/invertase (TIGR01784 family)